MNMPAVTPCTLTGCNYPESHCSGACNPALIPAIVARMEGLINDLRIAVLNWSQRAEEAETLLEMIGAGGVGSLMPVARQPLTDGQLDRIVDGMMEHHNVYRIARAVERAHGITGAQQ